MVLMPHWPVILGRGNLEPGTGRVLTLLEKLGNPHHHLPPVIHVAGTNGKGSTIAFMRAALTAAGYSVHVYTSPHLLRFNERMVLAGEEVEDGELFAALEECRMAAGEQFPLTFFEGTTVAALLLFSRTPADVLLIETGLGGRLDATNVIPKPAVTVVTSISLDHQEYLGPDICTVAGEKAGIAREGVPFVVAPQVQAAMEVLSVMAYKQGAELFRYGYEWQVAMNEPLPVGEEGFSNSFSQKEMELVRNPVRAKLSISNKALAPTLSHREREPSYLHLSQYLFLSNTREVIFPLPNLVGAHQITNAATAIAALTQLEGFSIPDECIAYGLTHAYWPARLQRIETGLARMLPEGWELWLDGAHNAGGAAVISQWATEDKPLYLIFGTTKGKDAEAFFKAFSGKVEKVYGVQVKSEPRSYNAEEVVAIAEKSGLQAIMAEDIQGAIEMVTRNAQTPGRILICGSLFLAADLKKESVEA